MYQPEDDIDCRSKQGVAFPCERSTEAHRATGDLGSPSRHGGDDDGEARRRGVQSPLPSRARSRTPKRILAIGLEKRKVAKYFRTPR